MMNGKRILKKTVYVSKILRNESTTGNRIDENFNIVRMNKRLRKTMEYYGRKRNNNCLDPGILLEEVRVKDGYYFVCLEGAARIMSIKRNNKIKYLKCRVQGAIKGENEIKKIENEYIEIKKEKTITIRFDDCPEEIKIEYSKKPIMVRTRMPTLGKI